VAGWIVIDDSSVYM